MRAESLREEQARLIHEIAVRAERLKQVTNQIESRWAHQARVMPLPTLPVRHASPQAGNVNADGRRKVTQK